MTRVRVLPERALSLNAGEGLAAKSTLHLAGDELELPAGEAQQLERDGFVDLVEPVKADKHAKADELEA